MELTRPQVPVLAIASLGLASVGISMVLGLALQTPGGQVKTGFAAMSGINALVVATVLTIDYRRHVTWGRLLAACTMGFVACVTIVVGFVIPQLHDLATLPAHLVPLRMIVRLGAVAALVGALALWDRPMDKPVRLVRQVAVMPALGAACFGLAVLVGDVVPKQGLILALQALVVLAVIMGMRVAERDPTGMVGAFTLSMTVAVVGTAFYAAQPPAGGDLLHVGDSIWGLSNLLLLVVAFCGIRVEGQERAARRYAALRMQIAGKLHDGLSQELALVASQTRWLLARLPRDDESLALISIAAQRALDESRYAMRLLKEADPEDFGDVAQLVLNATADELGFRMQIERFDSGVFGGVERSTELLRRLNNVLGGIATAPGVAQVTVRVIDDDGQWLQVAGIPGGSDALPDASADAVPALADQAELDWRLAT